VFEDAIKVKLDLICLGRPATKENNRRAKEYSGPKRNAN
jgi:hypothetical protein